jgi:hypothetical protein
LAGEGPEDLRAVSDEDESQAIYRRLVFVEQNGVHVACLRRPDVVSSYRDWLPYTACHLPHPGTVDAELADTGVVVAGAVVAGAVDAGALDTGAVDNEAVGAEAAEAGDVTADHCE